MPQNISPTPEKYCAFCSAQLERKKFDGRLESMNCFIRRKYCNQSCMAKAMVKPSVTRSAYQWRARQFRKSNCEMCGTSKRLSIHHKDKDWSNNDPSNLMTLCASCHTSLHHSLEDIVKTLGPRPCECCGRIGLKRRCCTCQTRIRRYGETLVKQLGPNFCWRRASHLIPKLEGRTA